MSQQKISYSAIVLTYDSYEELYDRFSRAEDWTLVDDNQVVSDVSFYTEDWKWFGHHMTLCLGPLPEDWACRVGEEVTISGSELAMDVKSIALRIVDFPRLDSEIPHITLACNPEVNGKPKDSKTLKNWGVITANQPIVLKGIITQIEYNISLNE